MVTEIDNHHGGSPGADAALAAITRRADILAADAGLDPMRGPGSGGHAQRRPARRPGPFPARRLPRRPGRASAGHPGGAQRPVERGRRRHPDAGPADHRDVGAALRRATRCCSTAAPTARRTSSPRSVTPPPCRRRCRRRRRSRSTSSTWCDSGSATPRSRDRRRAGRAPDAGADGVRQAGGPLGY